MLFVEQRNYFYFLKKYREHISPVAYTYAYCLQPNHFHICCRIKPGVELRDIYSKKKGTSCLSAEQMEFFVLQQFSNFLNCYAKSFNKAYGRKGTLFTTSLNRILIEAEDQLVRVIAYIHNNPVKHGFCKTLSEWQHSSYRSLAGYKQTWLARETVWSVFGGKAMFLKYHR